MGPAYAQAAWPGIIAPTGCAGCLIIAGRMQA